EAQAHATAAEVARAEAERTVETARAALGAARAAELRRATAEERRALLAARLADVEARLADRDPAAQAAAEPQRLELLARPEALATIARRLAEHRSRVDALSDRLRERRRRETESARLSAEQLEALRIERRALEGELSGVRERAGRLDVDEA